MGDAPDEPSFSIPALQRILQLEDIDVPPAPDGTGEGKSNGPKTAVFRGQNIEEGNFSSRVFGGQMIGQSLVAAARTVRPDFHVHSLHAHFLLMGDPKTPFLFTVDYIRDGRSFCTRFVTASQRGDRVFTMVASFQREEEGWEHSFPPPPAVPPPESVPTQEEVYRRYVNDARVPEAFRKGLAERLQMPFPLDYRVVDQIDKVRPEARPARQVAWMRAPGAVGDDRALHQCILAYGSDYSLLETALLPHGAAIPSRKVMAASLDHSIWFHRRSFRADEWLLYEMFSPAASGGRGLAFGRVFTQSGDLIATVAQEGIIRRVRTSPGKGGAGEQAGPASSSGGGIGRSRTTGAGPREEGWGVQGQGQQAERCSCGGCGCERAECLLPGAPQGESSSAAARGPGALSALPGRGDGGGADQESGAAGAAAPPRRLSQAVIKARL